MNEYLLIDGHNDLPWAHREAAAYDLVAVDLAERQPAFHTDLPRLREGGVGAQFWSVWVPSTLAGPDAVCQTLEQIDFVHKLVRRYDDLVLARTADDIEQAYANGRIASLIGVEGGHSINSSLAILRMMYALGARYMTLTHNDNLPWADSGTDVVALGGLNDFGRDVVAEMNRLGMMVDLAHVSEGTMRDALECSTAPVIFSHSNARAKADLDRNVPDDVLVNLASKGGVCMASFIPQFNSAASAQWYEESKEIAAERGLNPQDFGDLNPVMVARAVDDPPPTVTIADVVVGIEYMRDLMGINHIGIGSDFDGTELTVEGLGDVSTFPRLFEELSARRWSHADIDKLAGRNLLRVMRDVEEVAE